MTLHMEYRFERYASGFWSLRYWIDIGIDVIYHHFIFDIKELPLIAASLIQIDAQEANES